MTLSPDWICCQLGAREHYAVARALHRQGRLRLLITDAWMRPGNPIAHIPNDVARRLAERFHSDLDSASVHDLTLSMLKQEVEWRLKGRHDWELMIARNEWFQREAATVVERAERSATRPIAVFAYSNSARAVFRTAKGRGWTTVLGQIDPGEEHFTIVRRLAEASPQYGPPPPAPPMSYFDAWRDECALADHIVVNSDWSRRAIVQAGVDEAKIRLLPLVYENQAAAAPARSVPDRFTRERPLRLLFVGSVSVVKGVPELLDAMALLRDSPVTLQLVGAAAMTIPEWATSHPSIQFAAAVPRGTMTRYYDTSDVLVFPSHSDGFGIVQIEAQASGLPIIASTNCGQVVDDRRNGILLPEVTATAIADAIGRLVTTPSLVAGLSRQSVTSGQSTLQALGDALLRMVTQ